MTTTRLAILGAGPIGLEAALAAAEAGLDFSLYEAAATVGGHLRAWGHVRLFTPWSMNVSPRAARHLAAAGCEPPSGPTCPTGDELAERLLEPVARLAAVAPRLRLATRVRAVGRAGLLKNEEIATAARGSRDFRLLLAAADGREWVETASAVVDTTGTWSHPNALGDGGIPAPGEAALAARGAITRRIPDLEREGADWSGRTILLAGAGHSAQTAARDLAAFARRAPGTRVVWALRKREPGFGAVAADPLPARAALGRSALDLVAGLAPELEARRGVVVDAVRPVAAGRIEVVLRNGAGRAAVVVDRVLSLTGSVGDPSLYRQLQVHECYATCGPMKLSAALLGSGGGGGGDCLEQKSHGAETLVNPEPGFFILGAKSYGRNNSFLMRVGWEQVDEVFKGLLRRPAA